MTSDRWRRIEEIYDAALKCAANQRAQLLDGACAGDESLRRDVERLIAANDHAGSFLASPAWNLAPDALGRGT